MDTWSTYERRGKEYNSFPKRDALLLSSGHEEPPKTVTVPLKEQDNSIWTLFQKLPIEK